MGVISVIQGGALRDRYRALVLARGVTAGLQVKTATAGGLAGESVKLVAAAPPKLAPYLKAKGVTAYRLEANLLRSSRAYRFVFTDGQNTGTHLDTYTLPEALPPRGLTIAVGSCFYDGFNMGARVGNALASTIFGARPDFQFWVGDNVYADVPAFGLFAGNRPFEQTAERYLRYFDGKAYMASRARSPNYTAFDDHEFWNNYPETQSWLTRSSASQKDGYSKAALDCLDLFQASLNPAPVADGRSFCFDIPPLSFFFADIRSNRTLYGGGSGLMMTGKDLAALEKWAKELKGPGVLVLGQPLFMHRGSKTDYNPPDFGAEYSAIWGALFRAAFDVLVISGDVHHSRLLELSEDPNRPVYEFVSSPASHIPTVVTSVLPWEKQGQGSPSVPKVGIGAASRVKARYFFGTSAQNSLGLLRFVPTGPASAGVGAAFLDYSNTSQPVFARCQSVEGVPLARHRFERCQDPTLFSLRRRPPL